MDGNSRSRVLIVDDMHVNRLILSSLLSSHDIDSDLAEGGAECIELCQKNSYDLVLLDHRMPEIDGVDTLLRLKEIFSESGREIPIICHTTEDAAKNISLYKAAGFADVLIKPIEPTQLSKILMTYLPEGKYIGNNSSEVEDKLKEELLKLPEWLKRVPGINAVSGIRHCETVADYLDALAVFAGSIEKKASEIEKYYKEGNLGMYVLRVHSLKSMAAVIGAIELSKCAAELEHAGNHEDTGFIKENTPKLLEDYRKYIEYLAPLKEEAEGQGDGEPSEITEDQLKDAYAAIAEFVFCYDDESVDSTIAYLKTFRLPEEAIERIESLESAISLYDWEKLRSLTAEDGGALYG